MDRVGHAIGVSACLCGLRYLNPRMTPEAYAEFYASGAYREITQRLIPPSMRESFSLYTSLERTRDAERILLMLTRAKQLEPVDLLDVGGGSGGTVDALGKIWPLGAVTILDPCASDLAVARTKGYDVLCANAEDTPLIPPVGGILCVRTVDHLSDPLKVFTWWRAINPSGWLWLDVVLESAWKIDHPLYWSKASLWDALHRTGWRVTVSLPFSKGRRLAVLCV